VRLYAVVPGFFADPGPPDPPKASENPGQGHTAASNPVDRRGESGYIGAMKTLAPGAVTGIGSVPYEDPQEAVSLILRYLPEIPFWPQLVRLGFREEMVAQGAGGLPGLVVDLEARQVVLDPKASREMALAQFYETLWAGGLDPYSLSPEEAQGFHTLLAQIAAQGNGPQGLKGQVVGPVTFAGMVKAGDGKPILYDRELTQAVTQGLARKAAWQAEQFRRAGREAVIFFDEPILTGFGSAFLPVSREEVATILTETIEAVKEPGPVTVGVHCCGNTDWGLLLETPLDILSFDSYGYFDHLLLYDQALTAFFQRGGYVAWGLVPTLDADQLARETADSLWQRFTSQVERLAELGLGLPEVLQHSLLTPACGLGYLSPEEATRALTLLSELSGRAREWLAAQ
jgi:methionine synthase II (cobalamin-independent)